MIQNVQKLYGGHTLTDLQKYKLKLVRRLILEPVAAKFQGVYVTSGFRSPEQQAQLPKLKRAKTLSQHVLAEAVDFVCAEMESAYVWIYDNLGWWQLFIYFEDSKAKHLHVSIPSQSSYKRQSALYNVNGTWHQYTGVFGRRG